MKTLDFEQPTSSCSLDMNATHSMKHEQERHCFSSNTVSTSSTDQKCSRLDKFTVKGTFNFTI